MPCQEDLNKEEATAIVDEAAEVPAKSETLILVS